MKPRRQQRMSGLVRATTLFAAMNVLDGMVIDRNMQRHRHQEFIRFLIHLYKADNAWYWLIYGRSAPCMVGPHIGLLVLVAIVVAAVASLPVRPRR